MLLVALGLLGDAPTRAAVGCGSFCIDLTAHYVNDGCRIEVEALVNPFNDCGAALPGQLLICLFKNAPSSLAGTLVGCAGTGCELSAGSERWRVMFNPWPSPGTTQFFVEAWVNPGSSNANQRCNNVDPVRLPAVPPGDSDNDGVNSCADNCPNAVNPLQADVDRDEAGDVCDPTRADLDENGAVDGADLEALLACFSGSDVDAAPPGCSDESFNRADLDRDFDVDFADLAAFQVFFGQ
jgi:hypothetical protein